MSGQVGFTLRGRNPDVLMCIANLSNDEVFTPPELANRMLDTLAEAWAVNHGGANLWADKTVAFLDPCTKSGVFLREITRRLTKGLADEMPDLDDRVSHVLTKQVFGIGITHLTSLLARRSVYCSKHANSEHSIAKGFASDEGNIWFERTEHTWVNGRCAFCGTSKSIMDRGEGHATDAALAEEARVARRLVQEIRDGDRAAEARMVERYSKGLGYLLSRRVGEERAKDLLQETFCIAIEKLRQTDLDDPARLAGYLRGIAVRVALHANRQIKREPYTGDYDAISRIPDLAPRQFQHVARQQTLAAVRRLLAEMPVERDRELLYRFYIDDQDKSTICRDLGLDSLHFNRVLFRAKGRFRELLEKSGQAAGLQPAQDD
jgi:RNA polymerase sigma factor (sigma-70 family)